MERTEKKTRSKLGIHNTREKMFYGMLIAIPVIHFLVFYVYINFNSIMLAFQKHELGEPIDWWVTDNFKVAWEHSFGSAAGLNRIKNSIVMLLVMMGGVTPLAVLFSYYLYKKAPCSGFFKVILFMPQILSAVVFGLLFKNLTGTIYHNITGNESLLSNLSTKLPSVILFNILMGFGVNVLTYTSTMSGVNESLIESAQLDGANALQELWYIILPMIYPTVTTLMMVEFSHVFTNQFHLYTLFSAGANEVSSVGYYLYVQAQSSDLYLPKGSIYLPYTVLAAMGLIFTAIVLPTTLIARKLLEKYGPRAD